VVIPPPPARGGGEAAGGLDETGLHALTKRVPMHYLFLNYVSFLSAGPERRKLENAQKSGSSKEILKIMHTEKLKSVLLTINPLK
jgi:hypothetical protein